MFNKKGRATSDASEGRRAVRTPGSASSARTYSYYANRQFDASSQAANRARVTPEPPKKQTWFTKKPVRLWIGVFIVAILVIELTYLSSNGRAVVVDANGDVSQEVDVTAYESTFDSLLRANLLNHNKLTVDTNGIAAKMQRTHPELESVAVVTPLLGIRPAIYIHVSEPVFTLKQDASSYVLSAAGYITGRRAVGSLPVAIDQTGESVTVAKQLLPSSHVTFMSTIWYQLTKQGISLDALVLPKGKAFEIDARLKDKPYYLKFNVTEDATRQSGAAVAVIQQLGDTNPKEYIDLRVPGKAYYK